MWPVLSDLARTSGSRREKALLIHIAQGRLERISKNVRQVSNQFVVVPSRRRMEKYVLGLIKFYVDKVSTLKGFKCH